MDPGRDRRAGARASRRTSSVLWPAAAGSERWLALGDRLGCSRSSNMAGLQRQRPRAQPADGREGARPRRRSSSAAFAFGAGSWSHFIAVRLPPRRCAAARGGARPRPDRRASTRSAASGRPAASPARCAIPRRQLPRALGLGVAAVTAIYVADDRSRSSTSCRSDQATERRGIRAPRGRGPARARRAPPALAAVVAVSVVASVMALLLMAPRMYLAMSRRRALSRRPGRAPPGDAGARRARRRCSPSSRACFVLSGTLPADRRVLHVHDPGLHRARRRGPLRRAAPPARRGGFRCPGYPATPGALRASRRRGHRHRSPWPGRSRRSAASRWCCSASRPTGYSCRAGALGAARTRGRRAMTWIKTIPYSEADEKLRDAHRARARALSRGVRASRPASRTRPAASSPRTRSFRTRCFHAFATFGALMSPDLPLTRRQHEMITTVVSVTNRCHY